MRQPFAVDVVIAVLLVAVSFGVTPSAQAPTTTFEVASVRRNLSGSNSSGRNIRPGGGFTATNYPVARLIQFAYGIREVQVLGGPDWIRNDRYDINAKASGEVPQDQIRLLLQALLADRFKLGVRHEQREMAILELVLARTDGRVGPNLHDCSNAEDTRGVSSRDKPFMAPPGGTVAAGACGPISNIADLASARLQALVVDKTGLTGQWRYDIYFGPDLQASTNPNLPTFVGALREQLGLRLERTRAPVDVIVIDSIERPTDD